MELELLSGKAVTKALRQRFKNEFVKKLEAISWDMANGVISSEEGKQRSRALREENPALHALAMKTIGQDYGFAKEDEDNEKQTKMMKSVLKKRPSWLKPVKKAEESPTPEKETQDAGQQ